MPVNDPSIGWYQRFELSNGEVTPGHDDLAATMDSERVRASLEGSSILDIGTCNGGVAFIAQSRGAARVVGANVYEPTVFGFRQISESLGSAARYQRGTLYDLPDVLGGEFEFSSVCCTIFSLSTRYGG